jgi:hypothetical protein
MGHIKNEMKIILFIFFNITFITAFSQSSVIEGKTINRRNVENIPFANIELYNSEKVPIKYTVSDLKGCFKIDSILPGNYYLIVTSIGLGDSCYNVYVDDTLELDLLLPKPCKKENLTRICPFCENDLFVIEINPNLEVHYQFPNEESEVKYYKKIEELGYEISSSINQKDSTITETLIDIHIKGEKEKFQDPCYQWFCKKCKKIF